MKTTENNLDKIGKVNPFKVPTGYFENFSDKMIAQLPEKEAKEPQVVSFWERMKPWVYMAAMFTGIMLMVNIFVDNRQSPGILSEDVKSISIDEIDEFNSYYEDRMAYSFYQQTLYAEEDITDL